MVTTTMFCCSFDFPTVPWLIGKDAKYFFHVTQLFLKHQFKEKSSQCQHCFWERWVEERPFQFEGYRLNLRLHCGQTTIDAWEFPIAGNRLEKKIMCLIDQHEQISFRGSITVYTWQSWGTTFIFSFDWINVFNGTAKVRQS